LKRGWIIGLLAVAVGGCVTNPGDTQNLKQRGMDPVIIKSKAESDANREAGLQTFRIHDIHHTGYVALSDVAAATGFQGTWLKNGRTYGMGDTDPVWTWQTGDSRVVKAGREIRMPAPAVVEKGRLFIPAAALTELFGEEAVMSQGEYGISVLPRAVMHETGADGRMLPFHDARRKGAEIRQVPLTAYAQSFLGVPYEFGASPGQAGRSFDSGSYVRQVYRRFGIRLPRTTREQAAMGRPVSRDELRPGDLLVFNAPGRFKSLATPGHVGLYLGGGKMIHASPGTRDGVQITSLNEPYYLSSFLYAKRILPK
jgi:cell wall-associated NlpC family hydrolase